MMKEIACIAGGVLLGYSIAYYRLERRYEDSFAVADEDAKNFYRQKYEDLNKDLHGGDKYSGDVNEAAEAFEKYQGIPPEDIPVVEAQEPLDDSWDRERKRREVEKARTEQVNSPSEEFANTGATIVAPTNPIKRERPLDHVPAPVNYNAISTATVAVEEEPVETTEEQEDTYVPELLDMETWAANRTDYDQASLTYFAGDDVLAGESDERLGEKYRNEKVTPEIVKMLKAGPESWGGASSIYIRNVAEAVELEIVWNPENYVDVVDISAQTE